MKNHVSILTIIIFTLTSPIFNMEEAAISGLSRAAEVASWNEAKDKALKEFVAAQFNLERDVLTARTHAAHKAFLENLPEQEKVLISLRHDNRLIALAREEIRRTLYSYETMYSLDHLSKWFRTEAKRQIIEAYKNAIISRIHSKPTLPSHLYLDQEMNLPERADTKSMLRDRLEEIKKGPSACILRVGSETQIEDCISVSACEYIGTKSIRDTSSQTFDCTIFKSSPAASPSTVCEAADSPKITKSSELGFKELRAKP